MYALYFPEDGRYTTIMPLPKAKAMLKQFANAWLVDARTGVPI